MGDVVKQNSFRAWILAVRPKTLSGACVPVVVASSFISVAACVALPYVCHFDADSSEFCQ